MTAKCPCLWKSFSKLFIRLTLGSEYGVHAQHSDAKYLMVFLCQGFMVLLALASASAQGFQEQKTSTPICLGN